MKVAVSSTGNDLSSQIDPRFGRAAYFIIVETDDMSFEVFNNENIALSGGAGIQSAGFVSSKNIKAVLTGNCGPKAMQVFTADGIEVFIEQTGTVREAVERYIKGNLQSSTGSNVPEKFGTNETAVNGGTQPQSPQNIRGTGRGMGMGGGSGMGRGMGMGGGSGKGGGKGTGRGMGMGGGRGAGRGMGGISNMGVNAGMQVSEPETSLSLSKEEELQQLKDQSAQLKTQMEQIESRIKNLE